MPHSVDLGFGIVGTGVIADFHARAIKEAHGARLIGIAGRTEEKTREFALQHGAVFWTTQVAELAARPDIDVICIATPSGAHLEPALEAAKAGKHVIVEKPIEITLERVDALLRAADQARVCVGAIFQSRFGLGARTVKAAIEAGRFGRLVLCSAYVKWHRKPEYYSGSWHGSQALDGGGALMNQGIHSVDLLQWFAGMPAEVSARTARLVHAGIEAEDTAVATLRFPHGALGTIEASTAVFPGWDRRIEICGENGSAGLENDRIVHWKFREPKPGDEAILNPALDATMGSGSSNPTQIGHLGHRLQIQDMIDSIRDGRSPTVDGHAARNAVALVRAIYESAASGNPVGLP
jgi:predicted dehydrogenase